MTRARRSRRTAVVVLGLVCLAPATVTPAAAARIDLTERAAVLTNKASFDLVQQDWGYGYGPAVDVRDGALGDRADAFDGGLAIVVDDVGVTTRGGVAERSGPDLVTRAVTLSGLQVSLRYRAIPRSSTLRLLVRLTNPGRIDRRPEIGLRSGLGSDDRTSVFLSSSGDDSYDRGDRWLISEQASAAVEDPLVTQVVGGLGGPVPASAFVTGDQVQWNLPVRVVDHATRYLLFFARLSATSEDALNGTGDFNRRRLTAPLLAGISPAVRRSIVNWDL